VLRVAFVEKLSAVGFVVDFVGDVIFRGSKFDVTFSAWIVADMAILD
jgi:hypothetical protein